MIHPDVITYSKGVTTTLRTNAELVRESKLGSGRAVGELLVRIMGEINEYKSR